MRGFTLCTENHESYVCLSHGSEIAGIKSSNLLELPPCHLHSAINSFLYFLYLPMWRVIWLGWGDCWSLEHVDTEASRTVRRVISPSQKNTEIRAVRLSTALGWKLFSNHKRCVNQSRSSVHTYTHTQTDTIAVTAFLPYN